MDSVRDEKTVAGTMEDLHMKMQCSDLDDLLMEGDAASMQIARRHAASCEACAAQLAAWDDITATARSMRASWPNETLWPRIERSLKSDGRRAPGWRWQVAAALVLLAGLTAIVWTSSRLNRVDSVILRQDALNDVERAEKAHVDAINRLDHAYSALEDAAFHVEIDLQAADFHQVFVLCICHVFSPS